MSTFKKKKTAGGGLLLAIMQDLSPALVRDGGTEVEAITVDITVKQMQIVCSTAYGPQENDSKEKKSKFWKYCEEDVKRAKSEGKGYILQGDLNSWLSQKIIPNDPRPQNMNGKLMEDFLIQNNLTVVNGLKLCKGVFTRIRKGKNGTEKSILDFFVVSETVLPYIVSMEIDEEKSDVPSNYTQVRKGGKAIDSDHGAIQMNLNIKIIPTRPTRESLYNFKNEEGRKTFKDLTSNTNSFTECFKSMQPLQVQCENWKNVLESYCWKAFPKIRIRKHSKPSESDKLVKQRNYLKKRQDEDKTSDIENF